MSRHRQYENAAAPSSTSSLGEVLNVWLKTVPNYGGLIANRAEYSVMDDELTPHGLPDRPFNPCTHTKVIGSSLKTVAPISVDYRSYPDRTWEFRAYVGYHNSSASVPTDIWASLINSLASDVNGFVKPQSLLAVTLWELRQTYAMIRNPFNLLKPNWRAHASMHPARALIKKASDLWLEGLYGWKSCYYDIKGISAGLSKIACANPHQALEGMQERWSRTQKGQCSLPSTIFPMGGSEPYWNSLIADRKAGNYNMVDAFRVTNYAANWKATIGCKQRVAAVNDLRLWIQKFQTFGLDRQSILTTLWEIVPFSFVVDWFIDTQSIWSPLSMARLAAPDIRDLGCSNAIEESYRVEYFPVYDPWRYNSPWSYDTVNEVRGAGPITGTTGTTKTYTRSSGLPSLSTILTIFKSQGLNSLKLTSATSLIVQQVNNLFTNLKRVKTRRR